MKNIFRYFLIFILVSGAAFAKGGGGTQPICTATAPAQAAAFGFNTVKYCETFATNQGIDTNNTLNPGFNWYIQHYGAQPRNTIPPRFLLNDGTGTWLAGDTNSKSSVLFTAAQIGTTQNYVGTSFTGGFYAECDRKLNPAAITNGEPSMWFASIPFMLSTNTSGNPPFPYIEVDVFDWNNSAAHLANVYEWDNSTTTWWGNTNNATSLPGVVFTNYNTYGFLFVPSTQNGGTGLFKWYVNNVLTTTVTYTPGGAPSPSTCSLQYAGSQACPLGTYSPADTQVWLMMLGTDIGGAGGASQSNHTIRNCHIFQL